jgi:hypothetical protein
LQLNRQARIERSKTMSEPARARAVLSNEDFKLLREAVLHYLKEIQDTPDSVKFSNLYHRLGSASGR